MLAKVLWFGAGPGSVRRTLTVGVDSTMSHGTHLEGEYMLRKTTLAGISAAAAVLLLAGCANQPSTNSTSSTGSNPGVNIPAITSVTTPKDAVLPAGDGKATCSGVSLAYIGAETGPNAQLGINIYNGIQLAINQHNQANPKCQVAFKKFDTEGDPQKATGPVTQAVNSKDIVGVVGLPFSGESQATGNIFQQAGLVHITPSATNPTLTQKGWTTFFRGLGNDAVQGPAAAKFMTDQLKAKKIYVVQDDSDYGIGLAGEVTKSLSSSVLVGTDKVTTGQKDFSATVSKILNAKPDAVYYAGYYAEAAPFDQQLVNQGFKGTFVGPDGVKDDQFIKLAGNASNNTYFSCPCIPGELIPSFADAYQKLANAAPGTYSIEGYDAATILLSGIDHGKTTRAGLLDWVKNYDADGLSKHYKWDSTGELQAPTVYGYKVEGGKIVPIGTIGG
ncbi:MAG TPA: branched-chain amino acid ABC transporter substrate-binding protein [Microbacterium sp.]|uniref:branched-chain amino acid ABC transporter substrate-binding protein n=1 Tax=Microbacterium sp. TaxID=51671 RepID=UPI002B47BCF1|nr:branched-chain amino acid ABC transporter substrate-binding protein [Microbacterium sp.]HKT56743.1 branched-chain amino acid ABC transporter substrate-binding protein [Microbacterium sp.]